MSFEPKPIDTSGTNLPAEIEELTEFLARNSHEVWGKQRISDGWQYGSRRDDESKQHPCLVPYDELPESEKEYDRVLAVETIKLILSLGYQIVPPQSIAPEESSP